MKLYEQIPVAEAYRLIIDRNYSGVEPGDIKDIVFTAYGDRAIAEDSYNSAMHAKMKAKAEEENNDA